jgi:uncharacterized protein
VRARPGHWGRILQGMSTTPISPTLNITWPADQLAQFCRRWGVKEFSLFGSVLRDDFGPESDVDVLVSFEPGRGNDAFELMDMERELSVMLGREVDMVTRGAIERSRNWLRRREILGTARTVFAA